MSTIFGVASSHKKSAKSFPFWQLQVTKGVTKGPCAFRIQKQLGGADRFRLSVGLDFIEVRADTFGGTDLHLARVAFFRSSKRADVLLFCIPSFEISGPHKKLIQREKEIL